MMARMFRSVPWTAIAFAAALFIPVIGSRFYTSIATDVLIFGLFATSLNILLGSAGLVSFGHAAYFAIGAYACAIVMKTYEIPFALALPFAGATAATAALMFGFFCVRLTKIYFAMLTLAFAQIVWAICFKWNAVTGGEQGFANVPYPDLSLFDAIPVLSDMRASEHYFYLTLVVVGICLWLLRRITLSPFGRILTTIRENPERAEFVGIDVRRFELVAFVIAGTFAGIAGALFGIFNRGVFPDFGYWAKSAEVLIMVILGGMGQFFGPLVGAFTLIVLNQQITSYTEYWPLVLGLLLIVLLYAFPQGILGSLVDLLAHIRRRRDA
jgi:branched-chain amino acid transport system permease protein